MFAPVVSAKLMASPVDWRVFAHMKLRAVHCVLISLSVSSVLVVPAWASTFFSFDAEDPAWWKANGWANAHVSSTGWRADHITFDKGIMTITHDNVPCASGGDCSGQPYAGGEYRTSDWIGRYGRFEVRMKPAAGEGLISSFFVFASSADDRHPDYDRREDIPWDEIDIEFLGKDTTRVQFNYYADGVGNHEYIHDLGFDASQAFHEYAFDWRPDGIDWYVDGRRVHSVSAKRLKPGEVLPSTRGRIMTSVWAADLNNPGLVRWAGELRDPQPVAAHYDWVRYTPHPIQ